jgi:hypothetical protein
VGSGSTTFVEQRGAFRRDEVRDAQSPAELHSRDVHLDTLGNLQRQRLDGHLAEWLREDAALAHAGCVLAAQEMDGDRGVDRLVEPDLLQVDVRDAAAHGIDLVLLEDRRVRAALAVDLDVEDRVQAAGARERPAQLALLDADRDRLAGAVEDTRHDSLLTQAARLGRAEPLAVGDDELGAFSGHSGAGV